MAGTPEIIGAYLAPLEAFGWEPLFKAFDVYNNKKRPLTETELDKAETFVTAWSRAAKTNLGPYFEKFGIEYSKRLQMRLEKLKKFSPSRFPPALGLEKPSEDCFRGDVPLGSVAIFFSDYFPPEETEEEFVSLEEVAEEAEAPAEPAGEAEATEEEAETEEGGAADPRVFGEKIRV